MFRCASCVPSNDKGEQEMRAEEYLERDNSYLIIPRNTDNERSKSFWRSLIGRKASPRIAGTRGNQREAYEDGFKNGWASCEHFLHDSMSMPYPVSMTIEERDKMTAIIGNLGYRFIYVNDMPFLGPNRGPLHSGLNLCKEDHPFLGEDKRRRLVDKIIKMIEEEILNAHAI